MSDNGGEGKQIKLYSACGTQPCKTRRVIVDDEVGGDPKVMEFVNQL